MAAWARRPGDRIFDSVDGLVSFTKEKKDKSYVREAAVEHLSFMTPGDAMRPGIDPMYVTHPEHGTAMLNNHSFNQLCGLVGARAGEYKKLPTALAQIPLAWMAENADRKDAKLLLEADKPILSAADEKPVLCRAINSPTYGRIWNNEVASAVKEFIDPEVWTVPKSTAFHTKTGFITANDRKCFIFMVDEGHPIQLPGMDKPAYRGFYAWNSETGDGTGGIAEFLFFDACANRAIMGLSEFEELNIRHTAGAPDRWVRDAAPKLKEYCNSSPTKVQGLLEASRSKKVAKNEKGALEWLKARGFTKPAAKETLDLAREEQAGADGNASPYSVFNLVMGATARARNTDNNDDRVEAEKQAGKMMSAVA
jgi:hypothetical protein